MQAGLKSIRRLVKSTALPTGVEHTVLWGFDQLPQLYLDLNRTYDSRYSDRILGVIGGILKTLGTPEAGGAAADVPAATTLARLNTVSSRVISTSFSTRGFRLAISRSHPLFWAAVHARNSAPKPVLSTCVTLLKSTMIRRVIVAI